MSPSRGHRDEDDVDLDDGMRSNVEPGTGDPGWTWPPYAPWEAVQGTVPSVRGVVRTGPSC